MGFLKSTNLTDQTYLSADCDYGESTSVVFGGKALAEALVEEDLTLRIEYSGSESDVTISIPLLWLHDFLSFQEYFNDWNSKYASNSPVLGN